MANRRLLPALLLVLGSLLAPGAGAIDLSVSPNPAAVNQTVTARINALFSAAAGVACSLEVDFGDGSGSRPAGFCSSSPCILLATHSYATAGPYRVLARSTPGACRTPPLAPDPASSSVSVIGCPPLGIATPPQLPAGQVGLPYNQTLVFTGGVPPLQVTLTAGSLPPGLTLSADGRISGTPTSAGQFAFTVAASDRCALGSQSISRRFLLEITAPACLPLQWATGPELPPAAAGQAYSAQLLASGGVSPLAYRQVGGSLPPGLSLSSDGRITGVATEAGSYAFSVEASDRCAAGAQRVIQGFRITVGAGACPPLRWETAPSLPGATSGQPYQVQLRALGGSPPLAYRLSGGSLPPGLLLAGSGLISGVPASAGGFAFEVEVSDRCSAGVQRADRGFSLQVSSAQAPLTVRPVPAEFNVPRNRSSLVSIQYLFTGPGPASLQLSSASGRFLAAGREVGRSNQPLSATLSNGSGQTLENLQIPVGVVQASVAAGTNRFTYVREFSGAGLTVTSQVGFLITGRGAADFAPQRIQLYFENRRAEITVPRNQPGLRAYAELIYVGDGLLRGFWEVDGRVLARVERNLDPSGRVLLTTPEQPPLPTYDVGSHRLRFIITSPFSAIDQPTAIYFVTADEYAGGASIRLNAPAANARQIFRPARFDWQPVTGAAAYLLSFRRPGDLEPTFSAYTRKPGYSLPAAVLSRRFDRNGNYQWQVTAFDAENQVIGSSDTRVFTFGDETAY